MTDQTDRRAELIAAAAAGDLTVFERSELTALRRSDPTVDGEIAELSNLLGGLRELGDRAVDGGGPLWDDSLPAASEALGQRIRALASNDGAADAEAGSADDHAAGAGADTGTSTGTGTGFQTDVPHESHLARPRRRRQPRRRVLTVLSVIGCLALGFGAGLAVAAANSSGAGAQLAAPPAPTGPPGTLGAIETVSFGSEPAGVSVTGALVAHTWGTEALLEIDGLAADQSYAVIMVGRDGSRTDTGTFLGSTKTIDCQMNAAVLRQNVEAVEITDASGAVVAEADVPVVS